MRSVALILGLVCAAPATGQHADHAGSSAAPDSVPLYDSLGTLTRTVTTAAPLAQRYFDQGLRLTYGFGHAEAVRSFHVALRHDTACAMCWWGIAWARGPYINAEMDSAGGVEAYTAIQNALRLARSGTAAERALIDAMARRYVRRPTELNRAGLDSAYAEAMRDVVRRFPHDLDAATLLGEALMVLRPWDHWTRDGRPQPGTEEVLAVRESILARDIRHPGACHLYVHAVEASLAPERAAPCAELLGASIPGASHIPHMPSHIWMRIGRYGDGVRANQAAWHADQQAVFGQAVPIYPTHNLHMLLFAASMDGQSAVAWQAARDLARISTGNAFYVHLVLARFGRWHDLLEHEGGPPAPFQRGMRSYGRGLAHLNLGRPDSARDELEMLDDIIVATGDSARFRSHRQRDLLGIARAILSGEIAASENRWDDAVRMLREALPLEDSLAYDEPEPWITPLRHVLGAVLLDAGRSAEAERVYRDELIDHPANGWSLFGLERALHAQGRRDEAAEVRTRFDRAWTRADVWLRGSRF
jgi:tetratricopeptide (TPR) repeat protein